MMNIYDFALKMELDGEAFYRNLAATAKDADLKVVLETLADDEQRHLKIIQLAQQQTFHYIESDPSLRKFKNVFANQEFVGDRQAFIAKLKDEQIDLYRAALVKEQESVELYKQLKKDSQQQEEKVICELLLHEEEKHAEVIGNIIEMLNHVNDWVEAAEFNHQDAY
jgi:rubrerythrin